MRKDKSLQKYAEDNFFTVIAQASDNSELKSAVDSFLFRVIHGQDKSLRKMQNSVKKLFGNSSEDKKLLKEFIKNAEDYLAITAVENGLYLKSSIPKIHHKYVLPLRQNLINEYRASTFSELLIIDIAVNAYFRALSLASICNALVRDDEGVVSWKCQEKINLIKEVGKQVKIANHQFLTAITHLKEFHQKPLNIKVQTKSAFIAQNQQFNKNA